MGGPMTIGDEDSVVDDDIIVIEDISQDAVLQNATSHYIEKREYLAGTKVRTLRDVRIFKEWLQSLNMSTEIEAMDVTTLDNCLLEFYKTVRSKDGNPYTRSTLVGIRASINRYMNHIRPQFAGGSIMKSEQFHKSNLFLDKMAAKEKGKGRNTIKHLLSNDDLLKLMTSGVISTSNPLSTVRKVWFDFTLHFGIKGKEAIRTLKKDSFLLETDEHGQRYFCLNRDQEMPKIHQFSEMHDWNWYSRMYEIPDSIYCPVQSTLLYISKLGTADDFFQRPVSSKFCTSNLENWYVNPMGHNTLLRMMAEISEDANLSMVYTNICLKATIAKYVEEKGLDVYRESSLSRVGHVILRQNSVEQRENSIKLHKLFYHFLYK